MTTRAFTLIELLIVVAIIAVLAAIAVPNFLEAQARSKVARVVADHRTVITALEMYRVDTNNYPPSIPGAVLPELRPLTTPISYLTSIPRDAFPDQRIGSQPDAADGPYDFIRFLQELSPPVLFVGGDVTTRKDTKYFLLSCGPDRKQEEDFITADLPGFVFAESKYDATNGTVSDGDVYSFGAPGPGI